jgi:hypothetical protein
MESSMTTSPKCKFLASVLQRVFKVNPDVTPASVATALGYKSPFMVERWMNGSGLPDLPRLVALSNQIGWPLEDFVVAWCADQAPEHMTRFLIIAGQLFGLDAAENLLSGELTVGENLWPSMVATPKTAAQVAYELEDVPMGSYRDNRLLVDIAREAKSY